MMDPAFYTSQSAMQPLQHHVRQSTQVGYQPNFPQYHQQHQYQQKNHQQQMQQAVYQQQHVHQQMYQPNQQQVHYHQQNNVLKPSGVLSQLKTELSPLVNEDPFMLGYMECTQEAIRYLTEDEGLSADHPMVVGLKQHLYEQQRLVYIQYVLRTSLQLPGRDRVVSDHSAPISVESCDIQNVNDTVRDVIEPKNGETREINHSDHQQEEMTQNDKEKLAAQLAEELFSLLQEDSEYSDDELIDESEDDLVDEGFEEELNVES